MATEISIVLSALIGGGAGALGAMLVMNQRHSQLKQRLHQFRQEIDGVIQTATNRPIKSDPKLHSKLGQLTQNVQVTFDQLAQDQKQAQKQMQSEIEVLRRDFNQLRESQTQNPGDLQAELIRLKQSLEGEISALKAAKSSSSAIAVSAARPEPKPPAAASKPDLGLENVEEVINWLTARKVKLERYHQPDPELDALFNRFASELGNHYGSLAGLHRQMKRNVAKGSRFMFSLADASQTDIKYCTQFCSRLLSASLLSFYRYDRTSKSIQAALQRREDLIAFMTGKWFERFVYRKVADLLLAQQLNYKCLMNAQVQFANDDRYELDFLFLVEGQPIWIECKTSVGIDTKYLEKYSKHADILGIPKVRALLVILDIETAQAADWTRLWKVTVIGKDGLPQALDQALNAASVQPASTETAATATPVLRLVKHSEPQPAAPANLSAPVLPPDRQLNALLAKRMLQPHPEHRITVIHELNRLFDEGYQRLSLRQIKDQLAERLNLSKNKIQDILKAISRSGCFLGDDGKTISTFDELIVELIVPDPNWIDSQCIERYAAVALSADLDYFNRPRNRQAFEQVVGSPAPDATTLEALRADLQSLSQAEEDEEAVS